MKNRIVAYYDVFTLIREFLVRRGYDVSAMKDIELIRLYVRLTLPVE